MSERTRSEPDREALRRQWLAHAGAAFDLMFHPEHQADPVTFDQREATGYAQRAAGARARPGGLVEREAGRAKL